jgi:deazaflavin-dependent oxidoreductase (nitroreductase family)
VANEIRVPPKGTSGDRLTGDLLMKLMRPFFRRRVASYRKAAGSQSPTFSGFPVLLLTTVGARSGQERTHELGGFPDGDDAWLITATKGGSASHPGWFHNIAKNPDKVWAQVGGRKFKADVEQLRGEQRAAAYDRIAKVAPVYAKYPKKTDREIPVLRLRPAHDQAPVNL